MQQVATTPLNDPVIRGFAVCHNGLSATTAAVRERRMSEDDGNRDRRLI
jgi:hypothetical protein